MKESDYQEKFYERMTTSIDRMTEAITDIEKHIITLNNVAEDQKDVKNRLSVVENGMDFVKSAKSVFVALIIALMIGSGTAVWKAIKSDHQLTRSDILLLIKELKESS